MATHNSLTQGLAGYWACTEASGNRADSSSAANTLAVTGALGSANFNPTINTTVTLSTCVNYDANSSNFLAVADATKLRMGNTDYSLCCWVKLNAVPTDALSSFVGKAANEANGFEYLMGYVPSFGIYFNTFANGTATNTTQALAPGTEPIIAGKWYFVVGRKKASGPCECKANNGDWGTSAVTQNAGGGFAASVSKFAIGTRVLSGGTSNVTPINGTICNVGIWNRLLNDAECGDLWNGGKGVTYDFSYPDA